MAEEAECPVLLIEDEPDAAKLIQYVLSKGSVPKLVVDWAADLHSGLERLGEREFQAVLLDLNLPDSSGFETFARVRQQSAEQAVIILTAQEDEALALRAVRSGADDYLIKSDIRDRFLAQRIRYAIERRRLNRQNGVKPIRKGRIFGFAGAKGGVGTTTLVLNLAAALAKTGESVMAVELVPSYGSFAAHLRHAPTWNSSTLLKTAPEAITREQVESCLADLDCGFRALFGPQRPEDYCEVTPGHAHAVMRNAATLADFTLLDLSSSFAPYISEVIEHTAFMTLVVERDWLGLHAASAKLPLLKAGGARESAYGVALINKTPHVELLPADEFGRQLGCGIVGVVPAAGDLLAANHSTAPLICNRPDAPFSECIMEMASRFCAESVRFVRF
jgi:CheY-like chemotaxis protein/MinD-like ATPase involved in chromosome partitioning or flagellar assembly